MTTLFVALTVVFATGFVIQTVVLSRFVRLRREIGRSRIPKCACGHHVVYHERPQPQDVPRQFDVRIGGCRAAAKLTPVDFGYHGQCGCQVYYGPTPLNVFNMLG